MLKITDGCVDCAIPCVGGFCKLQRTAQVVCDRCSESADIFYIADDEVLCRECFIAAALDNAMTMTPEQIAADALVYGKEVL